MPVKGLPDGSAIENLRYAMREMQGGGFHPWVGKIWRRGMAARNVARYQINMDWEHGELLWSTG